MGRISKRKMETGASIGPRDSHRSAGAKARAGEASAADASSGLCLQSGALLGSTGLDASSYVQLSFTAEQSGGVSHRLYLCMCCDLFNAALQERRDAWQRQHVSITRYDQHKELTGLRAADPAWKEIPVWIARSAIDRVDRAFNAFFNRVKRGQKPGYPRFRPRRRYDSFDLGTNRPRVQGDRVHLPKIGPVKFHKYREMRGEIRSVSVRRKPTGRWTISFVCDLGAAPPKTVPKNAVGIDVGLEAFATLSNGERVPNPRYFARGEETLARRQRILSRRVRGSSSRERQRKLVAKAHEHIRNQRLNFARHLACFLFARWDAVFYEDLDIAPMVSGDVVRPYLAKPIYDAAWRIAIRAIQCKAEGAGKLERACDPRWTSILCSGCGEPNPKALSDREHLCVKCGLRIHRDHNSGRNILARGLRAVELAEVSEVPHGL